jgi:hypothetical protein
VPTGPGHTKIISTIVLKMFSWAVNLVLILADHPKGAVEHEVRDSPMTL